MTKKTLVSVLILLIVTVISLVVVRQNNNTGIQNKRVETQPPAPEKKAITNAGTEVSSVSSPVDVAARNVQSKTNVVRSAPPAAPFTWNGQKLSPKMELALGLNGPAPMSARMEAIHTLGRDLKDYEIEALMQFMNCKYKYKEDVFVIKNDILDALINQRVIPANLQSEVLSMFRDKEHELCWREFCVQHFEPYYRTKWPVNAVGDQKLDDPGREGIQIAYREAAEEIDNSIAGTALLGASRLADDFPEYNRSWIAAKAVAVAENKDTALRSKIAAVQVAGKMGRTEILPLVRELVQSDPDQSMPLRLAAIGALGTIGTSGDLDLLGTMAGSSNTYVQKAAIHAMKKLQDKLARNSGK